MTITEVLIEVIDGSMTYSEAIEAIDKNRALEPEDKQRYKDKVKKLCDKVHTVQVDLECQLSGIPNELFATILTLTISMVRKGMNTSDIASELYRLYRINGYLIQYFINEALHIYRMNTYTEEEFNAIGNHFLNVLSKAAGIEPKNEFKVGIKRKDINAEEIDQLDLETGDIDE